ncbi:EutP/PduV family microcompartment system protein [Cohnella cholangitidis]|uniref:Ethanolamine utilization protein EutP n=1 Tax=Cohnella cholangitidis TaxID=2598458 RepID=A0A7G5C2Z5_9BACL|nr:EutP/PduV family microcompartment system protein [Cohnella cholangitidis]QMV43579.1 ethanolamine utilization protein EutP [Cohnella cholangitidis]
MSRIMLIGAVGAGKSSLIRALTDAERQTVKTQSLVYYDALIDTPGEYTENPLFYRSLMATSHQAAAVLLVQDATRDRTGFPPGFAGGFPVPAIGAVTKLDHPEANTERAIGLLRQALPVGDIVLTSALSRLGIEEMRELLARYGGQAK